MGQLEVTRDIHVYTQLYHNNITLACVLFGNSVMPMFILSGRCVFLHFYLRYPTSAKEGTNISEFVNVKKS